MGCQDVGCGLEGSFKYSGVLHVVAGSLLYYTMLYQGILPLACSAVISFWGRQAKSCGLEGSFEHPGVHYQHNTHTSACSTCCGGSILLTIRLGIEELVAIPSSGRNAAFFGMICHIFSSLHPKWLALQACRAATSSASVGNRKSDSVMSVWALVKLYLSSSIAEMDPGSCVHASSWTIDSSVDPENFHPDNLQQCVSPTHHLNHSFPVSSLGNSIPYWGLLLAQYLRAPASAVRPKLEGSVCHKREVSSLSYTSWGCNTA